MYSGALMDLDHVDTAALLPECVGQDADVTALLAALDALWHEFAPVLMTLGVLATIDQQPAEVVDRLAHQFHCDYWDSAWPVETKRRVVMDSIRLHRIAGTRGAVEDVISAIWGDGAILSEWWEYGGEPGTFQVVLSNDQTEANVEKFLASIRKVRRATDHLTITTINDIAPAPVYPGVVIHHYRSYRM